MTTKQSLPDMYAVWGNPIEHSLSPVIHAAFAKQFNFEINYLRMLGPTDLEEFKQAFADFWRFAGKGCNITSPFKEIVFNLVTQRSLACTLAQACNTVVLQEDGSLYADNTDGYGLLKDLTDKEFIKVQDKVLVLGAGGAVKGTMFDLLQSKVQVDICNREHERAQFIAEHFQEYGSIRAVTSYDITDYDLVINAMALPHELELDLGWKELNPKTKFYDMQYHKTKTLPFLSYINKLCQQQYTNPAEYNQSCQGIGMLINQAAKSFSLWFAKEPNCQEVEQNIFLSVQDLFQKD